MAASGKFILICIVLSAVYVEFSSQTDQTKCKECPPVNLQCPEGTMLYLHYNVPPIYDQTTPNHLTTEPNNTNNENDRIDINDNTKNSVFSIDMRDTEIQLDHFNIHKIDKTENEHILTKRNTEIDQNSYNRLQIDTIDDSLHNNNNGTDNLDSTEAPLDDCCPVAQCIQKPEHCPTNSDSRNTWQDKCHHCHCVSGFVVCVNFCPHRESESSSCFSSYHSRPFPEGEHWNEGDCTHCHCQANEPKCQVSSCRGVSCSNPIKVPGECCPICDNSTSTTTIATPEIAISTPVTTAYPDTSVYDELTNTSTTGVDIADTTTIKTTFVSTSTTPPITESTPLIPAIEIINTTTIISSTEHISSSTSFSEPTPITTETTITNTVSESTKSSKIPAQEILQPISDQTTPSPADTIANTIPITTASNPIDNTSLDSTTERDTSAEKSIEVEKTKCSPEDHSFLTNPLVLWVTIAFLATCLIFFIGMLYRSKHNNQSYLSVPSCDSNLNKIQPNMLA